MLLNCGAGEDSWESFGRQGDQTSQSQRKSILNIHWKDWCWSWSSNTLATWSEDLTRLKRPRCWERLEAGGEGDNRGQDGWMASPTQWNKFEQAPGDDEGWGSLAFCSLWGCKELDTLSDWTTTNPCKFNMCRDEVPSSLLRAPQLHSFMPITGRGMLDLTLTSIWGLTVCVSSQHWGWPYWKYLHHR